MKSIALLATALFLASAPSPDSDTISEMTGGFWSPENQHLLLADESTKTAKVVSETNIESKAEDTTAK